MRVVKEPRGTAETEITYTFSIEATPATGPGGQTEATEGEDYTLGFGLEVIFFDISPESQTFAFIVLINDDDNPEGMESFQLVLSSVAGTQQFQQGMYTSTTVIILDDDREDEGREGEGGREGGGRREEGGRR